MAKFDVNRFGRFNPLMERKGYLILETIMQSSDNELYYIKLRKVPI